MRDLNWTILFCAALVARDVGWSQGSKTTTRNPSVSVTINVAQEHVRTGEPAKIRVVLQNISDHEIRIAADASGKVGGLKVRDAKGNLLPETPMGTVWNGNNTNPDPAKISPKDLEGSLMWGSLKPGEKFTQEVDVTKFYEIRAAGKYRVWLEGRDPQDASTPVNSNTITLTVIP